MSGCQRLWPVLGSSARRRVRSIDTVFMECSLGLMTREPRERRRRDTAPGFPHCQAAVCAKGADARRLDWPPVRWPIDLRRAFLAGLPTMSDALVAAIRRWAAWTVAGSLILAGCSLPYIPGVTSPPPSAGVDLRDANGRIVGSGVFLEQDDGVRVLLDVKNLPPGVKGVHIHEVGRCEPPTGSTIRAVRTRGICPTSRWTQMGRGTSNTRTRASISGRGQPRCSKAAARHSSFTSARTTIARIPRATAARGSRAAW